MVLPSTAPPLTQSHALQRRTCASSTCGTPVTRNRHRRHDRVRHDAHAADPAVQTLIVRLAGVKQGRLRENSILYEFLQAQIDGLTLTNNRGNRWTNMYLFFWLDMIDKMGVRGFNAFRGVPRTLSLPPGQIRKANMHVDPTAFNFNVPSASLLYDVGLPETDDIDGFGTEEHAEQIVKNILAATDCKTMEEVLNSEDPAIRMHGWVLLNFDGSADYRKTWVHYLGAAVQRVLGSSAQRGENQRWVQYPRLVSATDVGTPTASEVVVSANEPSADTRNWVRYTAGRSYPTQQFAQLFD